MRLALYRKWRPKSFNDVISQSAITTTLANEVKSGNIAHAFLFTGPRGTGKTTCAKILAAAVNCPDQKNGEPCLECDICKGIGQGSILDVTEIDAASNNGVDDIRGLREEANFTPILCKYRVYIIDEVHMLSTAAFNALLKTMEEPPAHVIFILATTEAHKVPATITSRCQRFTFRPIDSADIADRLLYIAKQEEVKLTEDAADMIAGLAEGAMRDAISILDQCLAFSPEVDIQTVTQAAGIADNSYIYAISDAVSNKDAQAALKILDELYRGAKDFDRLCAELLSHFRNLMIVKSAPGNKSLISCLPGEYEKIAEAAQTFTLGDIFYCLDVLQQMLDKLARSPQKRLLMEVCAVKLCSPGELITRSAPQKAAAPKNSAKPEVATEPELEPKSELEPEPKLESEQKITREPPIEDPKPKQDDMPKIDTAVNPVEQADITLNKESLLARMEAVNIGLANLLYDLNIKISGNDILLTSSNLMSGMMLKSQENRKILTDAVSAETVQGCPVLFNGELIGTTAQQSDSTVTSAPSKKPKTNADKNSSGKNELEQLADNLKNLDIEVNITE